MFGMRSVCIYKIMVTATLLLQKKRSPVVKHFRCNGFTYDTRFFFFFFFVCICMWRCGYNATISSLFSRAFSVVFFFK